MKRLLLIAAGLTAGLFLGACGDDDSADDSTDTTATAAPTSVVDATMPSTTPPSSENGSAAGPAAGSTDVTPSFTVGEPTIFPPDPLPGSDGASGSGCAPGGDLLPDGVWYGRVAERSPDRVRFDLACFYFGDIAHVEGAADGEEVNNDLYTRNASERLRTVPVDPSATVYLLESGQSFTAVSYDSWSGPSDRGGTVWLYVNAGRITEAQDQYTP